ncbi:MAG: hypothetical protein ACREUH_03800 [Burkholderiales bacterium]
MKRAAAAFIALQALAALALLVLSVHGPAGTALAAAVYFPIALGLTAWAAARRSWPFLLSAGVLLVAAAPGLYLALDQRDQHLYRQRVAATLVSELRDEPIVSDAGRPIGVRLWFTVSVPQSGSYAISPALYGAEGLYLNAMRRSLDARAEAWEYEAGRPHRQSAELYPPILVLSAKGVRCLSPYHPPLPQRAAPVPLRIVIYETPFAGRTARTYSLPDLYRNVMAERLPPCKAGL